MTYVPDMSNKEITQRSWGEVEKALLETTVPTIVDGKTVQRKLTKEEIKPFEMMLEKWGGDSAKIFDILPAGDPNPMHPQGQSMPSYVTNIKGGADRMILYEDTLLEDLIAEFTHMAQSHDLTDKEKKRWGKNRDKLLKKIGGNYSDLYTKKGSGGKGMEYEAHEILEPLLSLLITDFAPELYKEGTMNKMGEDWETTREDKLNEAMEVFFKKIEDEALTKKRAQFDTSFGGKVVNWSPLRFLPRFKKKYRR